MSKVVEMKVGTKAIPLEFSMEQFVQHYAQANQKQFNPDVLAEDFLYYKSKKMAPATQTMFVDGPLVSKIRKGFFSKKPEGSPQRHFLLFKDETWKEIHAPDNELTRKADGLWPMLYDAYSKTLHAAGKMYSTGKRIILDAHYIDMANASDFPIVQFWGNIDFANCAKMLNVPYFTLQAKEKENKFPFNATGLKTEIDFGAFKDAVSFLGGAVRVGIPGTEHARYTDVKFMLRGAEGVKALQTTHTYYGISKELTDEISNMKSVNLEDLLAMWQCAANNGFYQASPSERTLATKKPVSLTV